MKKNRLNIATIPGDGIGKEVIPEGIKVLKKVSKKFDINLHFEHFDFSSCDYYNKHGQMMPDDWKSKISNHDAIYFGAVGWPESVPDHISLWGSLLKFRREFDQYINLRPVKLMPGVPSPLANKNPGDIDFYIVRENTEGEYSSIGGKTGINIQEGKKLAILNFGARLNETLKAAENLKKKGIDITIVDARFAKPLDENLIWQLATTHEAIMTIEEGSIGGFGSHVVNFLTKKGLMDSNLKFRSMILPDIFIDQDTPDKMYEIAGLDNLSIVKKVEETLNSNIILAKNKNKIY